MPSTKQRAAEMTAASLSLMSSLGLQIGLQLQQAKYSMVTAARNCCLLPEVCWIILIFSFYLNVSSYFWCIYFMIKRGGYMLFANVFCFFVLFCVTHDSVCLFVFGFIFVPFILECLLLVFCCFGYLILFFLHLCV